MKARYDTLTVFYNSLVSFKCCQWPKVFSGTYSWLAVHTYNFIYSWVLMARRSGKSGSANVVLSEFLQTERTTGMLWVWWFFRRQVRYRKK